MWSWSGGGTSFTYLRIGEKDTGESQKAKVKAKIVQMLIENFSFLLFPFDLSLALA
jgi:hypothetical protein